MSKLSKRKKEQNSKKKGKNSGVEKRQPLNPTKVDELLSKLKKINKIKRFRVTWMDGVQPETMCCQCDSVNDLGETKNKKKRLICENCLKTYAVLF